MQLQSKHDSATSFVDAGNAYKKADPQGEGSAAGRHTGVWVVVIRGSSLQTAQNPPKTASPPPGGKQRDLGGARRKDLDS